ncbi:hypothetical protein [Pseudomonas viridiflava]|uniref:hypothetical protein n=1 Tax=Pseudomonas viridiflava TaxID=33069 RepID=UPI000F039D08|nr:hypothetical protein [Pseudomonas viridiflava]
MCNIPYEGRDLTDLEVTAIHEAAHAVAYHLKGCKILSVSVEADHHNDCLGIVHAVKKLNSDIVYKHFAGVEVLSDIEARVRSDVICLLAGAVSEAKATWGEADALLMFSSATQDYDVVQTLISLLPMLDGESLFDGLLEETEALVNDSWHVIQCMADKLVAQGYMDGAEVEGFFGRLLVS